MFSARVLFAAIGWSLLALLVAITIIGAIGVGAGVIGVSLR
jgi:hypothetical protein